MPHAHWLLALAMIPLVITLWDREIHYTPFVDRIVETLDGASDAEHDRIVRRLVEIKEGNGDVEELFDAFPRRRLAGAFLPRDSMMHWVFAFAASAIFLAFCAVLAGDGEASRVHILVVFLFTATIGILLLFALQALANLTSSYLLAGRGLFVVLFWAVKLIAYSYNAALDPNSNMIVSFLGFTVGVGLCEESCKLLPVIFRFREPNEYSWRNAFLLGLASGAGFGVAEGIIYAGNYYNGIAEGMTYLVRFASCVALHAVWTGSAAVTLFQRQNLLNQEKPWYDWVFYTIWFIAMPTVLHGIYDTMLKKGLPWAAAIAAIASFTWLAYHCTF